MVAGENSVSAPYPSYIPVFASSRGRPCFGASPNHGRPKRPILALPKSLFPRATFGRGRTSRDPGKIGGRHASMHQGPRGVSDFMGPYRRMVPLASPANSAAPPPRGPPWAQTREVTATGGLSPLVLSRRPAPGRRCAAAAPWRTCPTSAPSSGRARTGRPTPLSGRRCRRSRTGRR